MFYYSMTLEQRRSSVNYLNVGEDARITIEISNPGDALSVNSIQFKLLTGDAATDLAEPGDVSVGYPDGWDDLGNYQYAPPAGFKLGTTAITFDFVITVNNEKGTAHIGVLQDTEEGQATLTPPLSITKVHESEFVLANAQAVPPVVAPGHGTHLQWTATPGQLYSINSQGSVYQHTPPSDLASWPTPTVSKDTQQPSVLFTISASKQVDGDTLTAQAEVSVQIDVPQIISFPQPLLPFYNTPVMLEWEVVNADSCVLLRNGSPLVANAPLKSPAGGYQVDQPAGRVNYQIVAIKGDTHIASPQIIVNHFHWDGLYTVTSSNRIAVAGAPDGSVFYVCDGDAFKFLDATDFTTRTTVALADPLAMIALAARHGTRLFVGGYRSVTVISTIDFSASSFELKNSPKSFGVDPAGERIYVFATYLDAAFASVIDVYDVSGNLLKSVPMGGDASWGSIVASPDGSGVYIAAPGPHLKGVWRYRAATGELSTLCSIMGQNLACSADGRTLYVSAMDEIIELHTADGSEGRTFNLPRSREFVPDLRINALLCDPGGVGLYVLAFNPQANQQNLFFVDLLTGASVCITSLPDSAEGGLSVSGTGSQVYAFVQSRFDNPSQALVIGAMIPRDNFSSEAIKQPVSAV